MRLARILKNRMVQTVGISGGAIAASYLAFGGVGAGIALVLAVLFAVIRHDNALGTCFPLTVLLVIVGVVLVLLIFLLSLVGSR
jgi:hypothetical protein